MGNEKKKRNTKQDKKSAVQTQEKKSSKNDPKEQRQTRTSESEVKPSQTLGAPKIVVKQDTAEPVGPEYYKNLKRETEEILKIPEPGQSKFGKRQIENNWQKYDTPMECYDSTGEEDEGADFEKLIHAPISTGDHFQFKHEKMWGLDVKESEYDKYFDIDMPTLALGLCTIPFQVRNNLDESLFTTGEIKKANNLAYKFKQKYYRDADFEALPETVSNDKLLKIIMSEDIEGKLTESDISAGKEDDLDAILGKVDFFNVSSEKAESFDRLAHEKLAPTLENFIENKNINYPEVEVDTRPTTNVSMDDKLGHKEDLEEWLDDFLSN